MFNLAWIKNGMKGFPTAIRQVYDKPVYYFLSIITAVIIMVLDIGVINYKFFFSAPQLKVAFAVFFGTFQSLPVHSVILLIISSILSGFLIGFLWFHIKNIHKMNNAYATGTFGGVIGLIAPACTSCGIGLAAILGLTGFLSALPFQGTEIAILGICLLFFSIINLAAKITVRTCIVKKTLEVKT